VTANKPNWYWTLAGFLLVVIIVTGGIVTWSRFSPDQPIEISLPQEQERQGGIYVGGAVSNPGHYPYTETDSIAALVMAAGGTTSSANINGLRLYVPNVEEEQEPQKIDINRAEVQLLETLPGIGAILAQRIVDYRHQNGSFLNTRQIVNVAGIGTTTYDKIKHLITVAD